jgi:hypothetical protein
MGAKTLSGRDPVLVDDPQRAEFNVLGVEVIGEREAVEGLQPAMVGIAAFVTASDLVHRYLWVNAAAPRHRWGLQ